LFIGGPAVALGFALAGAGEDDPEAGGAAGEAAFDGPAVVPGFALAGAGEDDPEAGAVAAEMLMCNSSGITTVEDDTEAGGVAAEAAFDGPAAAPGFALAGAGEDDLDAGGAAAEAADFPPRLLT